MNRLTRASMLGEDAPPEPAAVRPDAGVGSGSRVGRRALAGPRGAALPGRDLAGPAVGSRCGPGASGSAEPFPLPGVSPGPGWPGSFGELTAAPY